MTVTFWAEKSPEIPVAISLREDGGGLALQTGHFGEVRVTNGMARRVLHALGLPDQSAGCIGHADVASLHELLFDVPHTVDEQLAPVLFDVQHALRVAMYYQCDVRWG